MRKSVHHLLHGKMANCEHGLSHTDNIGASSRLRSILDIRKCPKQVHRLSVQSQMLATLPIVQRTLEKEEEWRRSNGEISSNDPNSILIEKRNVMPYADESSVMERRLQREKSKAQSKYLELTSNYYAIMTSAICGLIMGFQIVDYLFEDPHGVRLLYDPSIGFLSIIENCEARIDMYSELLSDTNESHLRRWRDGNP